MPTPTSFPFIVVDGRARGALPAVRLSTQANVRDRKQAVWWLSHLRDVTTEQVLRLNSGVYGLIHVHDITSSRSERLCG